VSAAFVVGAGWIAPGGAGCVRTRRAWARAPGEAAAPLAEAFDGGAAPREFGRFDDDARAACHAVGLALRDAGDAAAARRAQTGVVVTGPDGSLASNLAYFRDYAAAGRTLGRGGLFAYTLPSSPGGEAAIAFGLRGPLVYVGGAGGRWGAALDAAEGFLADGLAAAAVVVRLAAGSAGALWIGRAAAAGAAGALPAVGARLDDAAAPEDPADAVRGLGDGA
jgi:hypothetical protein